MSTTVGGALAPGININNGVLSTTVTVVDDILNRAINIDLIANTNYDVDGTNLLFVAPLNMPVTDQAKADVADNGCSVDYQCIGSEDFIIPLDRWLNGGYVLKKCAINMVSPELIMSGLASYVKSWANAIVTNLISKFTAFTAYAGAGETNILEVIENMIVIMEQRGFSREDLTVGLSAKASGELRKLGLTSLALKALEPTPNDLGVKTLVDFRNFLGADDIVVYVKDLALVGTYCERTPETFEGTEKYKGRTLISGEMGYGTGIVTIKDDEGTAVVSGIRYAIPAPTQG